MQIRTAPQDQWAQLFEKLGDLWGRQIRYGDPPNNPDGPVDPVSPDTLTPDEVLTRGDLVMIMDRLSEFIYGVEKKAARWEELVISATRIPRKLKKRCDRELQPAAEVRAGFQRLLKSLDRIVDVSNPSEKT